jgi:protocatechuate 3,4-dioxygenase beta subunit
MIKLTVLFLTIATIWFANSQIPGERNSILVGSCEGCEAVFEYGNRKLTAVDTLPDFQDGGPKIKVTGTIYENDGKTPAEGVILYIYHTDQNGLYTTKAGETGWGRRHGYISSPESIRADPPLPISIQ